MSRRLWLVAPLATVALIAAGCGSSAPSGTGANGSAGTAGSGTNTKLTASEKAVRFAECMRTSGVPHFPDPDAKGNYNFGVDVSKAVFANAVNACKALEPPGALRSDVVPPKFATSAPNPTLKL